MIVVSLLEVGAIAVAATLPFFAVYWTVRDLLARK